MDSSRIARAVEKMQQARDALRPIDALPADARPADFAEGYAIQDEWARTMAAEGERAVGWKIACTSDEAATLLGAEAPFTGRIFRSVFARSPAELSRGRFHALGVEGEFAFAMGTTLAPAGRSFTEEQVADAVARLHPAIEVVSPRYTDWLTVGAPSLVADNAVSGALVLGDGVDDWRGLDLDASPVAMTIDGAVAQAGEGRLALGGPLKALTWCANDLARRGIALEAGQVVTTGTCTGVQFVEPGALVVAKFGDLGEVRIGVTD